jgi:hypothetical protein
MSSWMCDKLWESTELSNEENAALIAWHEWVDFMFWAEEVDKAKCEEEARQDEFNALSHEEQEEVCWDKREREEEQEESFWDRWERRCDEYDYDSHPALTARERNA